MMIGLVCIGLVVLVVVGAVVALVFAATGRPRQTGVPEPQEEPWRRAGRRSVPATALRLCPECGSALAADAPEGLCPQCLLKGAINSTRAAADSDPDGGTAAYAGPSTAPAVEVLAALLPQLEILELIGQGGMGAVYKARQPALDRVVALKVLPPEAGRDPAFAERFGREALALARLSHPNIVAVHEVGQAGEFYYIVMEYVDGINLRQLLRGGHLRPEQALRIIPQICDALQFAHEEGVVHRDIKPENILLDKKGRVKIADFGLAKLLGRDTENFALTGSRQVMGTLYYMAPEQVERPQEVDHRADIYSLGVVFYEMLTGQLPVGRFPLPSEKAGTDAYLDGVVLHALEREPERRYQHASDVKTDVEASGRTYSSFVRAPAAANREMVLRQVQGPANALMALAVLGPLGWLVPCLFFGIQFFNLPSTQSGTIWGVAVGEVRGVAVGCGTLFLLNAVAGVFLFVAGRKMKRLEAFEFSVIAAALPLLPFTTFAWPISAVVGGWALWVLLKPEVRAAFRDELQRTHNAQGVGTAPTSSGVP